MLYRTSGRVDNELLSKREVFLTEADFDANDEYFMGVQENIAVVTIGATAVTLYLPNPSLCKGLSVAVRGTLDGAGTLTITGLGGGRTVVYTGAGVELDVSSLFTSDGAWWHTTSGAAGSAGADGADGQLQTGAIAMSASVVPYRFLEDDGSGGANLASEITAGAASEVIGASYYLPPDHTGSDPGLYHPIGCQALIEMNDTADFDAGDLVFCGADGKAIDITQLTTDTDGYQPVGYAVAKLAVVEGVETATHVEVFMFPYGEGLGGVVIAQKDGEGMA